MKEIKNTDTAALNGDVTVADPAEALTAAEEILTKYLDAFEELAK